ncbi:hypothetical protein TNCV_4310721 [Trichonephila clavipes]|nr:hypothetical protein TNCV_4310721 [Trichonephila clavipes]
MNSLDDLVFNFSPSTHDGALVSLEPVKKTQRYPKRRRCRRLPQVFFHNQVGAPRVLSNGSRSCSGNCKLWENVPFAIRRNVIVGLQCKACVPFASTPSIPFLTRILSEKYKSERCFEHFTFVMDPFYAFPEHTSTTVVPVTLPDKPDALECAARQGQVRSCTIYQEPNKRSKVRITPVIRRVSRRPELPKAPGMIQPVQIPHVPEPVQIPLVPEPPVHIPDPFSPVQIPQSQEPVQTPQLQEPVQIPDVPEPVQIPDVPETVQIPPVQIPDFREPVKNPDVPEPLVQAQDDPQPLVQIPHVPQPLVQTQDDPQPLVQIPHVPQPLVQIPDLKQSFVQIPPKLDTLEPTDALDQLMSFVFGPADQEVQLLHKVPSIFDGDLISFLDEFERELAIEPMDFTMFFRVGRSPSRQVWEAYQPQNTEAYPLDLTHCTRLADVYVTWWTWLDDWEMHRDENLPWRMVWPQPWKRALELYAERSHQKALAHGMPSDVTLLEHI